MSSRATYATRQAGPDEAAEETFAERFCIAALPGPSKQHDRCALYASAARAAATGRPWIAGRRPAALRAASRATRRWPRAAASRSTPKDREAALLAALGETRETVIASPCSRRIDEANAPPAAPGPPRACGWPTATPSAAFAPREAPRVLDAAARAKRAFVAVVVEAGEVTLTVPWRAFAVRLAGRADAVARTGDHVGSAGARPVGSWRPRRRSGLARAGISVVPQCGYRTDHLLVREQDLERAAGVLEAWIAACAGPAPRRTAVAKRRR